MEQRYFFSIRLCAVLRSVFGPNFACYRSSKIRYLFAVEELGSAGRSPHQSRPASRYLHLVLSMSSDLAGPKERTLAEKTIHAVRDKDWCKQPTVSIGSMGLCSIAGVMVRYRCWLVPSAGGSTGGCAVRFLPRLMFSSCKSGLSAFAVKVELTSVGDISSSIRMSSVFVFIGVGGLSGE